MARTRHLRGREPAAAGKKIFLNGKERNVDDRSQPRIALETQVVVAILSMVKESAITLINSSILRNQIDRIPDREETRRVESVVRLSQSSQPFKHNPIVANIDLTSVHCPLPTAH